jgi:hypothetical protein
VVRGGAGGSQGDGGADRMNGFDVEFRRSPTASLHP